MQTYNKILITSTSAEVTLLDDGSDTELHGKCYIEENAFMVELKDDSTIVIPAGHYEEIFIMTSTGDCNVCLTQSVVDRITVKSVTGDIEIEVNTDNITMESGTGSCVKKGHAHTSVNSFGCSNKTMIVKEEATVSSSDFEEQSKGED